MNDKKRLKELFPQFVNALVDEDLPFLVDNARELEELCERLDIEINTGKSSAGKVTAATEMITVTIPVEDLDLPEGNWYLKSATVGRLSQKGEIVVNFIQDLEV